VNTILQELLSAGIYKRSQGRITRQVTFGAIFAGVAAGMYRLMQTMSDSPVAWRLGVPTVLLVAGVWVAYRLVNFPSFADFLIAVEAEMNKVSWPTRHELIRASAVVLVTMFVLTVSLLVFDTVWQQLFRWLRIVGS
jgi:preprotein translocase subunit SecE